MSSGCGDVLSLEDLKTANKHQTFEAEVITGKAGGVADGADIDFATNQVTGQTQKTLPAVLRDVGFEPASFDFSTGGTLTVNDRNKVVYDPVSMAWYSWAGSLPKVIPAATNPLLDANWRPQTDPSLRDDLASPSSGKGSYLVVDSQYLSIARTIHDIIKDIKNVKSYGAAGDYNATSATGTDDTAAFQAAIDDLGPTYRNGGIRQIRVPAGTYLVGHLTFPASLSFGVEFVGDGIMSTHIRSPKTDTAPLLTVNIEYVRFRNISFYGSTTDSDFSTPANWKQTCYFGKLGWNAADLDVSFINCKFSMFVDAIEAHGRGVTVDGCVFAGVTNEMHIVADPDITWTAGSASNSQYTGMRHYTMRGNRSDSTSRVILITGTAVWKDYIHDVLLVGNDYAVVDRLLDASDATIRRLVVSSNNSILSFRGGVISVKALNIFNISDNGFNSAYDDTVNPTLASDCISHLILGANSLFAGVISGNTLKRLRTNLIESTSAANITVTNNSLPDAWTLPANANHYVFFSGSNCPGLVIEGNNFQAATTSGNYHLFNTAQTDKTTRVGLNSAPWSWATEALTYQPTIASTSGAWTVAGRYSIDNGYCSVDFLAIGAGVTDTAGVISVSLPITATSLSGASSYSGGGEVHQISGFTNSGASILAINVVSGNIATISRTTNLITTQLNWSDRTAGTVSIMGRFRYKI